MTRKDMSIVAAVAASLGFLCLVGSLIYYLYRKRHGYGSVGKYRLFKKLDLNPPKYAKYLAWDLKSETEVIIKRGKCIAQELSILKDLEHPNICRLIEGSVEERFIALEAVHGQFLDQLLTRGHPTDDGIRQLLFDILSALAYLHSHNLAHRNLNASTILVSDAGNVKLFDFEYATPEQFDLQSEYDIYSVGAILLCCFGYFLPKIYSPYYSSAELIMQGIKDPIIKTFFEAIFDPEATAASLLLHAYFAGMKKECKNDLRSFILGPIEFRKEFSLQSVPPSNAKPLFKFEDLINVSKDQEPTTYLEFNFPNGVGAEALLVDSTLHILVKNGALVLHSSYITGDLEFLRAGSYFPDLCVRQMNGSGYNDYPCRADMMLVFLLPLSIDHDKPTIDVARCIKKIITCIKSGDQESCLQRLKDGLEKDKTLEFHMAKITVNSQLKGAQSN